MIEKSSDVNFLHPHLIILGWRKLTYDDFSINPRHHIEK
jgi:hypothetical protein